MLNFILWYLIITILGIITFPLAYRLLPALADRGYTLSRALGFLLWGYIFWLLGSLGILKNNSGGAITALLILVLTSSWVLYKVSWGEVRQWIRTHAKMIITVEVLFMVAFVGWAYIRSTNPDIVGTEKPMELAFINAILRSPTLPPNDPWLSGYSISYYYFGYLLVAMIARLAGTSAGVAFNLGVALVFALSALGSYSVLYNLLSHKALSREERKPLFSALLGPFFVLLVSNLGGLLHILRFLGVFWKVDENGQQVSSVWTWLDMGRYASPPPAEAFPHWWWWQASRIIQDFDFNWVNKGDIIDEFPFFSYLLADLHPHVLAMPVVFLAIALALNLFLGGGRGKIQWLWMKFKISPITFLLASVVLGSLAFFNTWDFPFYVALFTGAYILRELYNDSDEPGSFPKLTLFGIFSLLIKLGFALGVTGVILYLPFYFGFQSQAGGPLPNLIYITRGVYVWIHFIPLLIPILGFLFYLWKRDGDKKRLIGSLKFTLSLLVILLIFSLLLGMLIANIHIFQSVNPEASTASDAFLGSMAAPGWLPLIQEGFNRRFTIPGTLLTIGTIITFTTALLWPRADRQDKDPEILPTRSLHPPHIFALLLTLVGALLVLAPEFVFLRDLFGYRINTVFKFYFQVWLLWGIVAAYALALLWSKLGGIKKILFQVSMVIILTLSLTYPVMGIWTITNGFKPYNDLTLDGTAFQARNNPDETAAMEWLLTAPLGTVAEAIGGSYSQYARMASNSGQPTVLGWDFHEMQWRGGTEEMGSREVDIERMYCTNNWEEALVILRRYNVRYVVVGTMEYTAYGTGSSACPSGMNVNKFSRFLPQVFQQGGTTIYQVPDEVQSQ